VSWDRYRGKALADTTLTEGARDAQLEDYIRAHNPHLTDVRLERATAAEGYEESDGAPRRWYEVTYLADDQPPTS
jgi:hypothetical protein